MKPYDTTMMTSNGTLSLVCRENSILGNMTVAVYVLNNSFNLIINFV